MSEKKGARKGGIGMTMSIPELEVRHIHDMEFPETGNMLKFYWPTDTTMLLEVYLNGELAYAKEYSAYDSAYEVLFDLPEDSVLWKELEQKLSKWQNFSKDFKF